MPVRPAHCIRRVKADDVAVTRPILLTAFEPFGGDDRNPSAEVLAAVATRSADLFSVLLPVVYADAGAHVERWITDLRPAAWIGLGLHAGATAVTLERRAANADDAALADNAGDLRRGTPIDPAGPAFRPATVDWSAVAAAVPGCAFSDSAGRFVCNHTFYRAAAMADQLDPRPAVGFVHLPWPADWPRARPTTDHGVTFDDLVQSITAVLAMVRSRPTYTPIDLTSGAASGQAGV